MKLNAKQKRQLVRNIKRNRLAQMHALLREHGWKPTHNPAGMFWIWRKGKRRPICTCKWNRKARWSDWIPPWSRDPTHWHFTVASLRRRLEELSR